MEWLRKANTGCAKTFVHDIDFFELQLSLELMCINLYIEPGYGMTLSDVTRYASWMFAHGVETITLFSTLRRWYSLKCRSDCSIALVR